jgi:hypothetical protein
MEYRIARSGNIYGPYTEAEVRQYLASGNVVESDLARTESMTDWQPLRKILPKVKKQKVPRGTLNPAGLRPDLPAPPDMPWWVLLVLGIFTSLAFVVAWDIVQAAWLRRVHKQSHALLYYSVSAVLFLVNAPAFFAEVLHMHAFQPLIYSTHVTIVNIVAFTIWLLARFSMRHSVQEHFNLTEPIGLRLSWWWTLLFGGVYFQYQFNRINELRRVQAAVPPIAPGAAR